MVNNTTFRNISHLGDNLYKIRNERNMTRASLADKIGLSDQRLIYDYENNIKRPSAERLVLIANVLKVTMDSLVL